MIQTAFAAVVLVWIVCKMASNDVDQTRTEKQKRPWWRAGGMHITPFGSLGTIGAPAVCFARPLLDAGWLPFGLVMLLGICCAALSAPVSQGNVFVGFVLPIYMMTLVAGLVPAGLDIGAIASLVLPMLALFVFKTGVCMSVCLHRYAAHAAFACGPAMRFALSWCGCLANQGGPIWWASQHRCHHKFCDEPRDPHSAEQVGIVSAFAFFDAHLDVNEEFAPRHLESVAVRVLSTFACVPVMLEQYVAYRLGGLPGLWVSYTSSWLCQAITLWFNIVNHPPHEKGQECCTASDTSDASKLTPPTPPLRFLNSFLWVTGLIGEEAHLHHHAYPRRAKRPGVIA